MTPGYGNRIYVKRPLKSRKTLWTILLAFGIGLTFVIVHVTGPSTFEPPHTETDNDESANENPSPMAVQEKILELENHSPFQSQQTRDPDTQASIISPPQENKQTDADSATIEKARSLMNQRNYHEVIVLVTPMIDRNSMAIVLAAEAHFALMHYAESRVLYEQFLNSEPGNLAVIKRLIEICYAQNRLMDAQKFCEMGLTLNNDDEGIRYFAQKIRNELETASDFTSRESSHFTVSFDRGSHDDVRQTVLSILEEAYRTLGRDLGVYPERIIPVILYTQKTFFDVTRAPGWAGGLYDGKIRLPIAGLVQDEEELTRILTHEYVHALVHQMAGDCPRWLNEGLAEYYSREEVPQIGQRIPLKQLERYFPSSPVRAVAIAYAQSHAAVAYLIQRYTLNDLLELLKKLGEGQAFAEAFADVYYLEYSAFLENWGRE